VTRFYTGAFADTAAELAETVARDPAEHYAVLWLAAARLRAGQPALPELAANAERLDLAAWPGPVVQFYLGRIGAEALLAAAEDPDTRLRDWQLCEAQYYMGQFDLAAGRRDAARALFERAAALCPKGFVELTAARVELARMVP